MSYPRFQGYNGNAHSNNQGSEYGTRGPPSVTAPTATSPVYQAPTTQQQYSPTAYAWPGRSPSNHGNMNGNMQNYGSSGWKHQLHQQSAYDYQRPPTNYPSPTSATQGTRGWYGSSTQPHVEPGTHALSNLAYASGLESQEQQASEDRRTVHTHPGPQLFDPVQRDEHVQKRVKSPFALDYAMSNIRTSKTSQTEQSPPTSHENLAASAAAALAGAVNRSYESPLQEQSVSTQQYQNPAPSVTVAENQKPATTAFNELQQWPHSSHDTNTHGHPLAQVQNHFAGRTQPDPNMNRYKTLEAHRYARPKNLNATLPHPLTTPTSSSKPAYEAPLQSSPHSAGASRLSEYHDSGSFGIPTSSTIEVSNNIPRHDMREPSAPMPTFIDPSQVFNPYHKEHQRQEREQAERARGAPMEAPEANIRPKGKESTTSQPVNAGFTTALPTKQQAPRSADTNTDINPSSPSMPKTTERRLSEDVNMTAEITAMMLRMREWKTKDPNLFQKFWDEMKGSGNGIQPKNGQTASQSPQLTQAAPQVSTQSESLQLSQPLQHQSTPASQTLLQSHLSPSGSALKTPSEPKQGRPVTTVVENNVERLPDLGRFPDERLGRRANKESTDKKAQKESAKKPPLDPQTSLPQSTTKPNRYKELRWQTVTVPQPPPAKTVPSMAAPKQTIAPLNGGTIWPEAKRKALAEAAARALLALQANQGKSITAAEIHALLEQNPSYIELCEKLERRGLVFQRGPFARFLLHCVPDIASPSQIQNKESHQATASSLPPIQPVQEVAGTPSAGSLPNVQGSARDGYPPPQTFSHINHRSQDALQPKSTPIRPAKPRLGVPSPNIPAPVPGSKEAKARKRDFSELVDLTQLSDDEDYVMPRKQARHDGSPGTEESQSKPDVSLPGGQTQTSEMKRRYGSSTETRLAPSEGATSLKFYPNAQSSVSQLRSQAPTQPSQAIPQKSRHPLAKPLNKAEALRKSYYNPKTVARDILIAAGRHPAEHPLNAHLAGLLGKHIDVDSDLSTFDWDIVDPGGPPMPVVPVVDIPAGPPRWKLGQRPKARVPITDRTEPPRKLAADERSPTVCNAVSDGQDDKGSSKRKPEKEPFPDIQTSIGLLSSQTKSLLEQSLKTPKSDYQPTRLRQSQNVDEDASRQETTPHRPKAQTPINSNPPSSQHSSGRRRGRPRKSSIMVQATPALVKRGRGRPPGAKNKPSPQSMVKKATRPLGVKVSVPAPRRSTSSPQYDIYACQWDSCNAKLHNLPTLRKHIEKVHKVSDEELKSEGQPCWWENCRTLAPAGVEMISKVTFNSASDWLDHVNSDHLHPLGMELGDGPSSAQTGKPKPFEVAKYLYHHQLTLNPNVSFSKARTCSHVDPQMLARERQIYLADDEGRAVTAPSTEASIVDYPSDTLPLSSVTMNPDSNIPNRAFSKAHGNEKMEIKQSAIETLLALQRHKERVGPGLDRGGCTLVNAERRATLMDNEGMARVVDADY